MTAGLLIAPAGSDDRRFARHPDSFAAIYTAAGWGRPPQLFFTSFSSTLGMIHVLLPFMVLALYGGMRKIDPSYLRAAGLESDPVIAVVSTLLSGAVQSVRPCLRSQAHKLRAGFGKCPTRTSPSGRARSWPGTTNHCRELSRKSMEA
jgi:hypothetical protein